MRQERTKAIGYCRVSLERQAEKGVSIAAQGARLTAYAALYAIDLVETIVDAGASAKTLQRPGLDRALAMLRRGDADALLVPKLDRLTRSVRDLGYLVEKYFASGEVALLSVGEQIDTRTAGGRMVLNILGTISQWEREVIAERTSEALRHKARRGEFIGGGVPFGFDLADDGRRLVPRDDEQAVISEARRLRASGLSLRTVAVRLARRGLRSRTGRPFAAAQVARMVERAPVAHG